MIGGLCPAAAAIVTMVASAQQSAQIRSARRFRLPSLRIGSRRTFRAAAHDGAGRGRGRDRDPGLLRAGVPVREALPLTPGPPLDCPTFPHDPSAIRHHQRRPQPGRQPLILFLVVLWLALVAWTYFDARRRIEDPVLVACATAASLFPFVGTIVYSILRPPEFLADKRERELEVRASELRVRQLEEASCPNCEHPVERSFLRCPNCRARIKDPCESCGKPIDPRWSICPYCETPQRRAAPGERRPPSKRRGKTADVAASEPPPKPRRTSSRSPSSSRSGAPLALELGDGEGEHRRRDASASPPAAARPGSSPQ